MSSGIRHDKSAQLCVLLCETIVLSEGTPPGGENGMVCHWYVTMPDGKTAHAPSDIFLGAKSGVKVQMDWCAFLAKDLGADADLRLTIADLAGNHLGAYFGNIKQLAKSDQFDIRQLNLQNVKGAVATITVRAAAQMRWTKAGSPPREPGSCEFMGPAKDAQAAHIWQFLFPNKPIPDAAGPARTSLSGTELKTIKEEPEAEASGPSAKKEAEGSEEEGEEEEEEEEEEKEEEEEDEAEEEEEDADEKEAVEQEAAKGSEPPQQDHEKREREARERELAKEREAQEQRDREALHRETKEREAKEREAKEREAREREERELEAKERRERERAAEQAAEAAEREARAQAQQEAQRAEHKRRDSASADRREEPQEGSELKTRQRPSSTKMEAEAASAPAVKRASSTAKVQPRQRASSSTSRRSASGMAVVVQDPAAGASRTADLASRERRSTFRLGAQAAPVSLHTSQPYQVRGRDTPRDEQRWLEDSDSEELQFLSRGSSPSGASPPEQPGFVGRAEDPRQHSAQPSPSGPKPSSGSQVAARRTSTRQGVPTWQSEAKELGSLRRSFLRSASAPRPRLSARPSEHEACERGAACTPQEPEDPDLSAQRLDLELQDRFFGLGDKGQLQSRKTGPETFPDDQLQQLRLQLQQQQLQIREQLQLHQEQLRAQLQSQNKAPTHHTPHQTPPRHPRRSHLHTAAPAKSSKEPGRTSRAAPRAAPPAAPGAHHANPSHPVPGVALTGAGRGSPGSSCHANLRSPSPAHAVPGPAGSRRLYRVTTRGLGIRAGPNVNAPRTGSVLRKGDIFEASVVAPGLDGRIYLKIAGWRGWAFDDSAVDPADPAVEALSEQEAFEVLSVASKLSGSWQSSRSFRPQPLSGSGASARLSSPTEAVHESFVPKTRITEDFQGGDCWSTPTAAADVFEVNSDHKISQSSGGAAGRAAEPPLCTGIQQVAHAGIHRAADSAACPSRLELQYMPRRLPSEGEAWLQNEDRAPPSLSGEFKEAMGLGRSRGPLAQRGTVTVN